MDKVIVAIGLYAIFMLVGLVIALLVGAPESMIFMLGGVCVGIGCCRGIVLACSDC